MKKFITIAFILMLAIICAGSVSAADSLTVSEDEKCEILQDLKYDNIHNKGTLTIKSGATVTVFGRFISSGKLTVEKGSTVIVKDILTNGGDMIIEPGATVTVGGQLILYKLDDHGIPNIDLGGILKSAEGKEIIIFSNGDITLRPGAVLDLYFKNNNTTGNFTKDFPYSLLSENHLYSHTHKYKFGIGKCLCGKSKIDWETTLSVIALCVLSFAAGGLTTYITMENHRQPSSKTGDGSLS